VQNATFVGQLYLDRVGATLYEATATGTGSWTAISGGSSAVGNVAVSGNPNGVTTGTAALQIGVDKVAQTLWVFEGTVGQNTGWEQFI
jgi:hypothetical protein